MRLTKQKVLALFREPYGYNYITYGRIMKAYQLSDETAKKQLHRLKKKHVLMNNGSYDEYIPFDIRKVILAHWKKESHVALNCLPVRIGGTVTGGSGQLTMFNYLMDTLEELDLL